MVVISPFCGDFLFDLIWYDVIKEERKRESLFDTNTHTNIVLDKTKGWASFGVGSTTRSCLKNELGVELDQ